MRTWRGTGGTCLRELEEVLWGISQKDRATSCIVFSWVSSENLETQSSDKVEQAMVCGLKLDLIIVLLKIDRSDGMLNDSRIKNTVRGRQFSRLDMLQ